MRLGGGLDDQRHADRSARRSAGWHCLRAVRRAAAPASTPHQVRAVATQTLREARNRNAFLLRAQDALGYPIEVISGREEARLIFDGCMRTLPPTDEPRLVVDIGGALDRADRRPRLRRRAAESFQVGCVNTVAALLQATACIDRGSFRARAGGRRRRARGGDRAVLARAVATRRSAPVGHRRRGRRRSCAAEGWSDGTHHAATACCWLQRRRCIDGRRDPAHPTSPALKPERQAGASPAAPRSWRAVFDALGIDRDAHRRAARCGVGVLYDLLGRREQQPATCATPRWHGCRRASRSTATQAQRVARVAQQALCAAGARRAARR
ncbi:MAG: hypothetical protein MZW92_04360 [Comamonadaceae bacterium]|nr:hypothetical protein [Comamonadaceae bacterium]